MVQTISPPAVLGGVRHIMIGHILSFQKKDKPYHLHPAVLGGDPVVTGSFASWRRLPTVLPLTFNSLKPNKTQKSRGFTVISQIIHFGIASKGDELLIEVANWPVDMYSWDQPRCYPRGSFYPLSPDLSTQYRGITKTCFRICSTRRSCS